MKNHSRILICPLEWGLGHAGRCIPLAAELKSMGHEIIFATGEKHLTFLKREFPDAEFMDFPGFNPSYSRFLSMWMTMAIKSPCLLYHIIREHLILKKIIRDNKIDAVISDNRFGLWNKNVKSVYVTHQLRIKFPKWTLFVEPLVASIHKWFIRKYDYCLVPDLEGDINISGELSHGLKLSPEVRFIGLLSRFWGESADLKPSSGRIKDYILLILSGPEPQKTIFKNKIIRALGDKDVDLVILGAKPEGCGGNVERTLKSGVNIVYYDHLPTIEMRDLIENSDTIIARSGYTSIMELISLGKSALLVPTPGQTEQEYLAKTLSRKGWFSYMEQKKIDRNIFLDIPVPLWSEALVPESRLLLKEALNKIF